MRGAIPPLPNTPSWRGAQLSTGTNLPLPLNKLTPWNMVLLDTLIVTQSNSPPLIETENSVLFP
jgi:hypothetical protein